MIPCRLAPALLGLLTAAAAGAIGWRAAAGTSDGSVGFDPRPWVEDLEEARLAFAIRYADLEWEVTQRGLDLSALFADARQRLLESHSETGARLVFNQLARRFGDRHVHFNWPTAPAATSGPPNGSVSCRALGFDSDMAGAPLASLVRGYAPLLPAPSEEFQVGTVAVGRSKLGILKIPLFSSQAFPELCRAAIVSLRIDRLQSCDQSCIERIRDWSDQRLTTDLVATLTAIRAARIDVLLVDLAGNGGGSEWAEAAARMLTSVRLQSAPMHFVRGEHWSQRFAKQEAELRAAADTAAGDDRAELLHWAELLDQRRRDAQVNCDSGPLWQGKRLECLWLGDAFYSTGILQSASLGALRGKPWARLVFTPAQYPYQEAVWSGPLIVLVDGSTGSAAEQFAAEMQDNRAAVILGAQTVGAGCGFTDGGTPTTLRNSRAVLALPDCLRTRLDGRNLASGVQPDVPVDFPGEDSPLLRAQHLQDGLYSAVRLALKTK